MACPGEILEVLESHDIVSELNLARIAEKICKWEDKLAFLLGLKEADIVVIQKNHPNDYHQQKLQCLFWWKNRSGGDTRSACSCLLKAVRDCNQTNACSFIAQLLRSKCNNYY